MKKTILLSVIVLIMISPAFSPFNKEMSGFHKNYISSKIINSYGSLGAPTIQSCQRPGPHVGECAKVILDQSSVKIVKDDLPDSQIVGVINKYIN